MPFAATGGQHHTKDWARRWREEGLLTVRDGVEQVPIRHACLHPLSLWPCCSPTCNTLPSSWRQPGMAGALELTRSNSVSQSPFGMSVPLAIKRVSVINLIGEITDISSFHNMVSFLSLSLVQSNLRESAVSQSSGLCEALSRGGVGQRGILKEVWTQWSSHPPSL